MPARILPFRTAVRSEVPKSVFAFESLPRRSDGNVTVQERGKSERLISEPRVRRRVETSDPGPFTA